MLARNFSLNKIFGCVVAASFFLPAAYAQTSADLVLPAPAAPVQRVVLPAPSSSVQRHSRVVLPAPASYGERYSDSNANAWLSTSTVYTQNTGPFLPPPSSYSQNVDADLLLQTGSYGSAWGNVLAPMRKTNDSVLFISGQGERNGIDVNDYSWIASVGVGYRKKYDNKVAGFYLYADNVSTNANHDFYVMSPGFDIATRQNRLQTNFYAPCGTTVWYSQPTFADQLGIPNSISTQGHSVYGDVVSTRESALYGFDSEYTYTPKENSVWRKWLPSIGTYIFSNFLGKADNVYGGEVGLEYLLNHHWIVGVSDHYDSYNHNFALGSLSFVFRPKQNDVTLSDLLLYPVYRNLDLNTTQDGVAAISNRTVYGSALEYQNVYFINNGSLSSIQNGTMSNPYTSLDQAFSAGAPSNATFWVNNSGTAYTKTSGALSLSGMQNLYGRNDNFSLAADGRSSAPTLILPNGITTTGINTISGFILQGNGTTASAGVFGNGGTLTLSQMFIGSSALGSSFNTGVKLDNGANATVSNSTITIASNTNNAADNRAYGIRVRNNSRVNVSNTGISASNQGVGNAQAIRVGDGGVSDSSSATINNSTVTATATGGGSARALQVENAGTLTANSVSTSAIGQGTSTAFGLLMLNSGAATLSGGSVTATTTGSGAADGIAAQGGAATLSNVAVSANATSSGNAFAFFSDRGIVNITGGSITGSNTGSGRAYGLDIESTGNVTANNVLINASAQNNNAFGGVVLNSATVHLVGGSVTATTTGSGEADAFDAENTSTLTTSNTALTANAQGSGRAVGIVTFNTAIANITNGSITAHAFGSGDAYGYFNVGGTGSITANNVATTVTGTGNPSSAISAAPSTVTFNGGTCVLNGMSVTCA